MMNYRKKFAICIFSLYAFMAAVFLDNFILMNVTGLIVMVKIDQFWNALEELDKANKEEVKKDA